MNNSNYKPIMSYASNSVYKRVPIGFVICVGICVFLLVKREVNFMGNIEVDIVWLRRWGEGDSNLMCSNVCIQPIGGISAIMGMVAYERLRVMPIDGIAWLNHIGTHCNLISSAVAHCSGRIWAIALDGTSLVLIIPAPVVYIAIIEGRLVLLFNVCIGIIWAIFILDSIDVGIVISVLSLIYTLYGITKKLDDMSRYRFCIGIGYACIGGISWFIETLCVTSIERCDGLIGYICDSGSFHAIWHICGACSCAYFIDIMVQWSNLFI